MLTRVEHKANLNRKETPFDYKMEGIDKVILLCSSHRPAYVSLYVVNSGDKIEESSPGTHSPRYPPRAPGSPLMARLGAVLCKLWAFGFTLVANPQQPEGQSC